MNKTKYILLIVYIALPLLLAGCTNSWGENKEKTISFDNFSLPLSSDFEPIEKNQIENKYLVNKILSAFIWKKPWFDPTILVGYADLGAKLSPLEFADITREKLAHDLIGYKGEKMGKMTFECNGKTVEWYIHVFRVINSLDEIDEQIIMMQYLFIANTNPYIISFSTTNRDDLEVFEEYLGALKCGS